MLKCPLGVQLKLCFSEICNILAHIATILIRIRKLPQEIRILRWLKYTVNPKMEEIGKQKGLIGKFFKEKH